MKPFYVFILLLSAVSCSLSADQERKLNAALSKYLNARNEGQASMYVAMTHPNAVAYYTRQGDSIFQARYSLTNIDERPFLMDGTFLEVESKDKKLQVRYSYWSSLMVGMRDRSEKVYLIALSENEGETWFFLDEEDYYTDEIIKPGDRLLSK